MSDGKTVRVDGFDSLFAVEVGYASFCHSTSNFILCAIMIKQVLPGWEMKALDCIWW